MVSKGVGKGFELNPNMVAELGLTKEIQDIHNAQSQAQNLINAMQLADVNETKIVSQNILGVFSAIQAAFTKVENSLINLNSTYGISLAQALQLNGGGNKNYHKDVANSKAVANLKMFDGDREKFTGWNDKLINAMSRLHPAARTVLKGLNKRWAKRDKEFTSEEEIQFDFNRTAIDENIDPGDMIEFDTLNEDLYYILVEKTEGESAIKVKSVDTGSGLMAYHRIYWWFVKTSGIALQDRSRKVMYPEPVTREEKMMEGIEAWEAHVKVLDQHGDAYELKPQNKIIALELLLSKFSTVFENIERATSQKVPADDLNHRHKFEFLLSGLKEYAAKRRWDAQHKKGKGDPADIGEVDNQNHHHEHEEEGSGSTTIWVQGEDGNFVQVDNVSIDAIGKGKAKGKGGKREKGLTNIPVQTLQISNVANVGSTGTLPGIAKMQLNATSVTSQGIWQPIAKKEKGGPRGITKRGLTKKGMGRGTKKGKGMLMRLTRLWHGRLMVPPMLNQSI